MLKQLRNNEKGVVFITVLMIILVMAVLTVSILSMNVSQTLLTEGEIQNVQAESLAFGGLARAYSTFAQFNRAVTGNLLWWTESVGDRDYNIVANLAVPSPFGPDIMTLNIIVFEMP